MLLLANGDKFEGNWKDGKREGKGLIFFDKLEIS